MWVCINCQEECAVKLVRCRRCDFPKNGGEHLVVQNYTPDTDGAEDQLTLSIGDLITVLEMGDEMWKGKIGKEEGWFPQTCVENKLGRRQKYKVIKPYLDVHRDHLNVNENDIVTVINKRSNGLTWVQLDGHEGWIPGDYLEIAITDLVCVKPLIAPKPAGKHPKTNQAALSGAFQRPSHYKKCIVLYDYNESENLTVETDDVIGIVGEEENGWFLGHLGDEKGLIPASYVQVLEHQDDVYCCVTDLYTGVEIGDLKLHKGDIVKEVNRRKSGWLWVIHRDEEGWYPENHVMPYNGTPGPPSDLQTCSDFKPHSEDYINIENELTIGPPTDLQTYGGFKPHTEDYINIENELTDGIPSDLQTYGGFKPHSEDYINIENELTDEDSTFMPPPLPARPKCRTPQTRNRLQDKVLDTYGNDDQLYYSSSTLPPLPVRQKCQTPPTKNLLLDTTENTYGNDDRLFDKPPVLPKRPSKIQQKNEQSLNPMESTYGNMTENSNDKPPVLPKRPKKIQQNKEQSLNPIESTYGNMTENPYDDVYMVKKQSTELMEYGEPKKKGHQNDIDAEKPDDPYHEYDYIQDKYASYTELISKEKPQPTFIETPEKPALPKRPPPTRPPPPQAKADKTSIHNDEDTGQMTKLYGKREVNEIRLVMVGRTGSGKSATGNTLMSKSDHFESKISGGSVTRECKRGECNQLGRKMVVVDTPGLFDTQVPEAQISKEIIRCVNMSTPGPHAFLLVIQIARFTDEEIETFNRLFDLFGDGMGRFAIIVFTKLDDLEREKQTIEEYIEMAPKKLKEFLERCQGRYIAIDNKASEHRKMAKVKYLIQQVDIIGNKNGGKYYTNEMYREAEAALQRKIKVVEEEKALEKKKEIDRIQSTFVQQIDSIKQENKKLAKQVSSKEAVQRQIQRDKEKANQEINKMKEEMKKIDKKRNEEMYRMKKIEKEEKEKQANVLEEKERQQMQFIRDIQQQQIEMNRRYSEKEKQKELQLSKVTEQHNKTMETEIQRIVDGNNQKYNEMMRALEAKDKANEKLQEQMAQQNASMQEIMRESDQRNRELRQQLDENRRRMTVEKKRAEEILKLQLEDQKNSMDAKAKSSLQDQMEREKRQRQAFEAATCKANEKIQEQMTQQNALMQNMMLEREQIFRKQQENQKKSMDAKTQEMIQKQRETDERQMKEFEELKLQNDSMQEQLAKGGCMIT